MSWQEESTWKHVIDKHKGGRGDEKKKKSEGEIWKTCKLKRQHIKADHLQTHRKWNHAFKKKKKKSHTYMSVINLYTSTNALISCRLTVTS